MSVQAVEVFFGILNSPKCKIDHSDQHQYVRPVGYNGRAGLITIHNKLMAVIKTNYCYLLLQIVAITINDMEYKLQIRDL